MTIVGIFWTNIFLPLMIMSIVLYLGGIAALMFLGSMGMVAVSALIAYQRQSWVTGMRVFLAQAGCGLGLLAGGVTGRLLDHIWLHSSHPLWMMVCSAAVGALFGITILLLSGEAVILIVGSLSRWATTRISSATS